VALILPRYPLKESGNLLIVNADGDGGTVEGVTLQCAHCGGHWQVIPKSGRRRGWCRSCDKPTCGARACLKCVPMEKQIEEIERRGRL